MTDKVTIGDATRPLVRWHGGKWILAPWIIGHFPDHRCYVEPYGGGASVLLRKQRTYSEVYNDLDGEIVNLFQVVRDAGKEIINKLRYTPFSRDEFNLAYEVTGDEIEQARRTLVRSFMGFSSNAHAQKTGFRANSSRSGTTPALDWANYPKALEKTIERLRGVVIENRDAFDTMAQHDAANTLHYIDPPYMAETRDNGSDYNHELSNDDHKELAAYLHSLKGMVVLSGYETDVYDKLFADWICVKKCAYADGARERTECLWMSHKPPQGRLFE